MINTTQKMIKKTKGFRRIYYATKYSLQGLTSAFKSESAFRQELAACLVLVPIACFLDISNVERVVMILVLFIVLITELLNTAIEALADHVSTDHHPLIGQAKDVASAAVFISLVLVPVAWLMILL